MRLTSSIDDKNTNEDDSTKRRTLPSAQSVPTRAQIAPGGADFRRDETTESQRPFQLEQGEESDEDEIGVDGSLSEDQVGLYLVRQ